MPYTHAVFISDTGKGIIKHSLHDVSFAILQLKELVGSEDTLVGLLWLLEYLKKPAPGFFKNPLRTPLKEALIEYSIILPKNDDYVIEKVFRRVLLLAESQNNLYERGFKAIQNVDSKVPLLEDESSSSESNRFEELANSITIELDFWDQDSGRFSNPDAIPERELRIKLGKSTQDFLRTLEW